MMVPGTDLLSDAFCALETIDIGYRKFLSRTINEIGVYVPTYDEEVPIDASVQSVDRNVCKDLGLDWQKNYLTVYTSTDVVDIDRGVSGDQFNIFGKIFQIVSSTPWFDIDGWSSFICVEIRPSTK